MQDKSGFVLWWHWFTGTIRKPVGCLNFWVYFVVGILVCGGAGVWSLFFVPDKPSLLMAICSFYLAIAGASCMDFLFGEDERKYIRGFSIFVSVFLGLATLFAVSKENYSVATLGTAISLVLWWLANAENPKLTDVAKALSSVGGDASGSVKGCAGDMKI